MKKVFVILSIALVATFFSAVHPNTASARPDYFKTFQEHYKESSILEDAKKAKCNTCHYGKSKKNRNDYGKALSEHLTKKQYQELRKDKAALADKVDEALKEAEKAKSVSGELFGKLIEGGQLPGTAPEEEETP